MMSISIRPTRKQTDVLLFIDTFIKQHGYSPSYREIMVGCSYSSVSNVAVLIKELIRRGHLRKNPYHARSLEVVTHYEQAQPEPQQSGMGSVSGERWLIDQVSRRFSEVEKEEKADRTKVDELYVLVGALRVLGQEDAARAFIARLSVITV